MNDEIDSIFSGALSGAPRIEMYRSWVYPDLYPDEKPARLENWEVDDIIAYCGGVAAKYQFYRQRYILGMSSP